MKHCLIASLVLTLLFFGATSPVKAQATPTIAIASPTNGQVVSESSVSVNGSASGLAENSVMVQALDGNGNVLAQQTATLDASEPGAAGNWSVNLPVAVEPGTAGSIYAFSAIPGGVAAEASVPVVYGEAAPLPQPTAVPTEEPIVAPPIAPTVAPTEEPTIAPTVAPTALPTETPTVAPTAVPTEVPTAAPTIAPTTAPTVAPTTAPTVAPTLPPTVAPTALPTETPTTESTAEIASTTTATPTSGPTATPTLQPTPTATSSGSAAVAIAQPLNGDTVNPQSIEVYGSASGLPKNSVVVQARTDDGTIFAQAVAVVNAPMGGTGQWSTVLTVGVDLGTTGNIYAFGLSPTDGSVLAEAQVNVTFGVAPEETPTPTATATPQPLVTIDEPDDGDIVDVDEVDVEGSGAGLPDNNVIVRALDASGYILAEEVAELSSSDGSEGSWSVALELDVDAGTSGSIVAYAIDPTTGLVVTNDRVRVTFGQPPAPVTPALSIQQPAEGAVVNATNGFAVSGTSAGLPEGTVVVRFFNQLSQIIYQTVTTAGVDGLWSVAARIFAANGTPATIYVFSPSPADGTVIADDQVNVILASSCVPRTDWIAYTVEPGDTIYSIALSTGTDTATLIVANCLTNPNVIEVGQIIYVPSLPVPGVVPQPPSVTITSPAAGASVAIDAPTAVTGSSSWTQPGLIWVRALDNVGNVLDEVRVTAMTEPADGTWTWQANLEISGVTPGTYGTLIAYVPSLIDGSIVAYQAVQVIYGGDQGLPYIFIQGPPPYLGQSLDNGVTVSGQARGIEQGIIVVQAFDDTGNVIAEIPTFIQSTEVGGEGDWIVTLPITFIGHGKIKVSATNSTDGTQLAVASVDVLFGYPPNQANYVYITYPLPNTLLESSDDLVAVAGYAGGLVGNTIYLSAMDAGNRARFVIPVSVDLTTSKWTIVPGNDRPLTEDGTFSLYAASTEPTTGQVIAFDRIDLRVQRPVVTGEISFTANITPPVDSIVAVRIVGMPVNPDEQQVVLSEQSHVAGDQLPIPFALPYDPAFVDEGRLYLLEAEVRDASGNVLFTSTQPIPVITQDAPVEGIEVIVEPVS